MKHQVGYHKLISNQCEWNSYFIKYQTQDKNISNFIFYRLEFSTILMVKCSVIKLLVPILDKLQDIGFIP